MATFFAHLRCYRRSSPQVVFGGPIGISRLFLSRSGSMPVVCNDCQTLNGRAAKMCRGCAAKLPAYYAAAMTESAGSSSTPPVDETARHPPLKGHWLTTAGASIGAIAMLVSFGWVFERHEATPAQHTTFMSAPLPPEATASSNRALLPLQVGGLSFADARPISLVSFSDEASAGRAAARPQRPEGAHSRVSESYGMPRHGPAPALPAPGRGRDVAHGTAKDPAALCQSYSFVAKAICMTNSCAQPGMANHAQCRQVLAQRRVDEARRNPTL